MRRLAESPVRSGVLIAMGALLALFPSVGAAQNTAAEGEMPYMDAVLGEYTRPIQTSSDRAQMFFTQGLQMVYAFTYPVAIRSFEEAQRLDPDCAMCYWGEALARGPFLNSGMRETNATDAFESAQKALSLIDETDDPVEKGLIRAMAQRYSEVHDPDTRASLDSAYSQAMSEVYRAYPEDSDVATLYAESLMLLNPARAEYKADDPFVRSFHSVLEGVLAREITHPGACHLYIHATEATSVAYKAEACADLLMDAVPGASHLNHMPSHTYNVIGRWDKAVLSNVKAWHSDERSAFGEGVSYAGTHNLHMLFYAASMGGQGALATSAAEEYARQVTDGVFYHSLVLFRFGKFDKVLELDEAPEAPLQRGLWEFSRGYAHLRTGSPDSASYYLAQVEEKASTLGEDVQMRGHTANQLLSIVAGILRGEIQRSEGDMDAAIRSFEASVDVFDTLHYDEPEPLNFTPRHWLGAALLEEGRYAEAEEVYRASLEAHPDNGWAVFGLEQALRAQGRDAEADRAKAHFQDVWERADIMIRSTRF